MQRSSWRNQHETTGMKHGGANRQARLPLCSQICLSACFLAATSDHALAHASDRIFVLTLPTHLYYAAGAATVFVTALIMLLAGPRRSVPARRICSFPDRLPVTLLSSLSAMILTALIVVGFHGNRDPLENLLVLVIWTLLWVGMTLVSVLFGNVWSVINPWIGPVRLARRLLNREAEGGLAGFGYWPAVIGFLGFAWFEIVSLAPDDPAILARAVLIYWTLIFVLAVYAGEPWLEKGEFLTVFFGLMARIAPIWPERDAGRTVLMVGLPASRLARMPAVPASGFAFVTLVLTTLSFDGLSETFWWLAQIGINPLEFPGRSAVREINSLGLLILWAITAIAILLAIYARADAADLKNIAGRVILSFLPIAAGYHIAHYLVALLVNGQYALQALSDPFGRGWDLFGLGEHFVSTSFAGDYHSMLTIWNVQAICIIAGHVIAIVLAHRITDSAREQAAGRPSLIRDAPMTVLMVFYTVFALWLLSSPTGA